MDLEADDQTPYVVAAVRPGPAGAWAIRRLGPHRSSDFWDDHPSIAAGGRSWSAPRLVARQLSYPRLPAAAVAPDGALCVTGDARLGVWLARSNDRGRTFRLAQVWEDARIYAFADTIGYGGTTAVASLEGHVHPFWIDTSDRGGRRQEAFAATLP